MIAHRAKPIYIACLATQLPVIGVHRAFGHTGVPRVAGLPTPFANGLRLLGVSDAVRNDLRLCLPTWPAERIETLHNRLDVPAVRAELVNRVAARAQLGLPPKATVIGKLRRLHPDKDQATLLAGFAAALPNLPEGSLLAIIGNGPRRLFCSGGPAHVGNRGTGELAGSDTAGPSLFHRLRSVRA